MSARRRLAGFTLVELMVALFVLALVAVLSWRGLDGMPSARAGLRLIPRSSRYTHRAGSTSRRSQASR